MSNANAGTNRPRIMDLLLLLLLTPRLANNRTGRCAKVFLPAARPLALLIQ
jgi:hypothetical protein